MHRTSEPLFASRITNLRSSPIREILHVLDRPGMISFAGGLPSANSFPQFDFHIPDRYLQYGASEGEPELREKVAQLLAKRGLNCQAEQIFILSGSQQGIDLVGKLFIESGRTLAIESPTYLAALQVFELYGAKFTDTENISSQTTLAYINPTFQNPTGICYSAQQREQIARQCDQTRTTLFEDDPYHDLVYESVCRTPVCSMIQSSHWIYQGSFSKSLAPGLRLGFMACSSSLVSHITQLKQAADLHSNRISQYLVFQNLSQPDYSQRIAELSETYKNKRDFFNQVLEDQFQALATWSVPAGGLFFWLKLHPDMEKDIQQLFENAISQNIAFMPGAPFFAAGALSDKASNQFIRLNFSNASEHQITTGLSTLAGLLKQ